jgi:hypothetical protein
MDFKKNKKLESFNFYKNNLSIPGSPLFNVLKRFGRDELIALFFSIFSTVVVSLFTKNVLLLSLAAPILEKIGFFPGNFYDTYKDYKKNNAFNKSKNTGFNIKSAFKNSFKSLTEDVFLHDPIYVFLMYVLLSIYSQPIWLITFFSFIMAVFLVSLIEVSFVELSYFKFKRKLKNKGMHYTKNYEAIFKINKTKDIELLFKNLAKQLNLKNKKKFLIKDIYFENKLKTYSQRKSNLRLRSSNFYNNKGEFVDQKNFVEINYGRSKECTNFGIKYDQFRYFLITKEKFKYKIKKPTLSALKEKNKVLYDYLEKYIIPKKHRISYYRIVYYNSRISINLDYNSRNNYCTLEIRSHKNKKLLIQTMQKVMLYLPVIHTTYSKFDIHKVTE